MASKEEMKRDVSFDEQLPLNTNMALPYIKLRLQIWRCLILSCV